MAAKKIMIGVPYYKGLPEPRFQLSITNLAFALVQRGYFVDINYKEGTVISTVRNTLAEDALKQGYDLIQLDTDMVFNPPDVVKILDCDLAPVVGGLYFATRKPHQPLVFQEDLIDTEYCFRSYSVGQIPEDPFKCVGVALGVSFIKYEVFSHLLDINVAKRIGRPFNHWQLNNGREIGEDLSFCHRCNLEGIEQACVPDVDIIHMSKKGVGRDDHFMELERDYHYANCIPGWMTTRELNWIFKNAKQYKRIAEIGSWKGKSTHAFCSAVGPEATVFAIDHFKGSPSERGGPHREAVKGNVFEEFYKNVGMFSNLEVIKSSSVQAAADFYKAGFELDMTFIDGDHTYDAVIADIEAWDKVTRCLISGHDYTNIPEVHRAVNDYFGRDKVGIYDSIWFVKK